MRLPGYFFFHETLDWTNRLVDDGGKAWAGYSYALWLMELVAL